MHSTSHPVNFNTTDKNNKHHPDTKNQKQVSTYLNAETFIPGTKTKSYKYM